MSLVPMGKEVAILAQVLDMEGLGLKSTGNLYKLQTLSCNLHFPQGKLRKVIMLRNCNSLLNLLFLYHYGLWLVSEGK